MDTVWRASVGATFFGLLGTLGCGQAGSELGGGVASLAATGLTGCANESFAGHRYAFCDNAARFADARAACETAGGHLVSIESAGEDVFVHAHARKKAWIGGVFSTQQSDWRWLGSDQLFWTGGRDGATAAGAYSNWAPREPNNQEHHGCSGMSPHDGVWNAWECNTHAGFVCEIETGAPPAPGPDDHCTKAQRGGHDYWFCRDDRGYDDARTRCQGVGMDLATIADSGENTFVAGRADSQSYVGLNDRGNEAAWKWLAGGELTWCGDDDGRKAAPASFASWAPGQPATSRCTFQRRDGHGYWFCDDAVSFTTARDVCQSVGMTLAKIDDATEDAFVRGAAGNVAWLGAQDAVSEGSWSWLVDGVSFWANAPVTGRYANWKQGQPSGGTSMNCLVAQKQGGGTWAAARCADLNGFVCESPTAGAAQLPDHHDCATVSVGTGKWTAVGCAEPHGYVCETVDANAYATLGQLTTRIRDDYRTGKPRVGDVVFRDNTRVTEPFSRFGQRLGLRECVDGLEPDGAARPVPGLSQEAIDYRQTYKQIPVHGRGYAVKRDPTTRFVKSFTGRVEHDIDVDTEPTLNERQALTKVKDHLRVPPSQAHKLSDVAGTLAIFARTQGDPPIWELAYLFTVPAGTEWPASNVVISAKTGAVLMNLARERQVCTSQDVTGLTRERTGVDVTTFQQDRWDDRSDLAASRSASFPTQSFLYSQGVFANPSSPLSGGPHVYSECPGEDFPSIATVEPNFIVVDGASPESYRGAAFQMAVQRCLEFYARDMRAAPGVPWLGYDGAGQDDVRISLFKRSTDPNLCGESVACYRLADLSMNYRVDADPYIGASIEVACHELTHGVFDATIGQRITAPAPEMVPIDEGIADIFGNAAEMGVRGYPGPGAWCMAGDAYNNERCGINMRDPAQSAADECAVLSVSGAALYASCPKEYLGPGYCTLAPCNPSLTQEPGRTRECCGTHRNGTVMSHWAYLVANGDAAINGLGCAYDVTAIDPDLRTSVTMASQLVLDALRNQELAPNTGYRGIAEATINAAARISPDAERIVTQAWFAANVKEALTDADAIVINPPRDTEQPAYPWVDFRWPLPDNVTSWDIQIGTSPFTMGGQTTFERRGVRAEKVRSNDGTLTPTGFISLAFPNNNTDTWFWRVRPHSDADWTNCYPNHAFFGTTAPEIIEVASVQGEPDDGKVRPGNIQAEWSRVRGAKQYEVTLSTRNLNCVADANAITAHFDEQPGATGMFQASISGVQPEEHYFMGVMPIGPEHVVTGQPARGECTTVEFDTKAMRAPELQYPADGYNSFAYPPRGTTTGPPGGLDPRFNWLGVDGPSSYELRLFEIMADGKTCEATPRRTITGDYVDSGEPCPRDACQGRVDELPFPDPNPSGYCWDVRSLATNGRPSPRSERRVFQYVHRAPHKLSPGIQIGLMEGSRGETSILPGDSFGKDVTFRWESDPIAGFYGFKLGIYPWDTPISPFEPANCHLPAGIPFPSDQSSCTTGPRRVTYRDPGQIVDTELTLPGNVAGRGRYCWTEWPVLDRSRQPLIDFFPQYCYTSGPERPRIDCPDAPADGSFYEGQPIHCTIQSAYVPASQLQLFVAGVDSDAQITVDDTDCQPEVDTRPQPRPSSFGDIYDCEIRLEIQPQPGQDVLITGRTWNSDQHPPVRDEQSQLEDVTFGFNTGALPPAPVPIYPLADDEVIAGQWIWAEWRSVAGVSEYRLTVWEESRRDATLQESFVTETKGSAGLLGLSRPKRLCWSVQSVLDIDGERVLGREADPICFDTIRPRITIESPANGSSLPGPNLHITWRTDHPPQKYGIFGFVLNNTVPGFNASVPHDSRSVVQSFDQTVTAGETYTVDVCVSYVDADTSCASATVTITNPATCSPPVVPSALVPWCQLTADAPIGGAIFKPVSGAVEYVVEYDTGTGPVTRTLNADSAFPVAAGTGCSSAGWHALSFLNNVSFEVLAFRMKTRTANCESAWSPIGHIEDVTDIPGCVHRGFCGSNLCDRCWPPG